MNFKIKELYINDFRCMTGENKFVLEDKTKVYGDNETGKSTFASAILWCLTGKNVDGSSNFEIVPYGKYGIASPLVRMVCDVDNKEVELSREYKANFARDKTFNEYITVCSINGIEYGSRKFQEWIDKNICNEQVFKIIGNPYTFIENPPKEPKELIWQTQRRMLFSLVGGNNDADIMESDATWQPLSPYFKKFDTGEQILTYLKTQMKKVNETLISFESKLEQQLKNNIDIEFTEEEITNAIDDFKNQLATIEAEIEEQKKKNKNENILKIQSELTEKINEREQLLINYRKQLSDFEILKANIDNELNQIKLNIQNLMAKQVEYREALDKIRTTKIKAYCETCKQPLPKQAIDQVKINLNERLKKGTAMLEELEKELRAKQIEYEKKLSAKTSLTEPLYPAKEKKLKQEIDQLGVMIASSAINAYVDERTEEKAELKSKIDNYTELLFSIRQNKKNEIIIQEIEAEHKEALQKQNEIQMHIDICKDFISFKCSSVEAKVNSLFDNVKFELFEKNKTNDDVKDCCNLLFNGIKYSELSASTKLIANLELVSAFQKCYNAYVPIMIDNMESVTADIVNPAQIIEFYVEEEVCPNCNGKSGRRKITGVWECENCHHEWTKTFKIKENKYENNC